MLAARTIRPAAPSLREATRGKGPEGGLSETAICFDSFRTASVTYNVSSPRIKTGPVRNRHSLALLTPASPAQTVQGP